MKKTLLIGFLSIIFFSLVFVGQTVANDKNSSNKNVGKFISVSENGNVKGVQGASTAIITGTNIGQTIGGLTNPISGASANYWAGTFSGTVDGNAVNFYCIDIANGLVYNEAYSDEGDTPVEMTYILNNYYPYASNPNALSTNAKEASAVQAALWHFADGLDISTIGTEEIRDRVSEIVADANANANYSVFPDFFTIAPSSRELIEGTTAEFEIAAFDTDGNPYPGLTINLITSSGILSANQVTTDGNGVVTFTVDQNGGNYAQVTATSTVNVPQGTQYFHVANPDGRQKLVLATPIVASGSATAEVNWYEATECDLHNYTTYTIGGWGGPANGGPGRVRDAGFDDVFPNGITFGGNYTITFTSARAVQDFLPSGSTAGSLTQNYVNPTSPTSAGVLADQLLAATMNVYYHDGGYLGTNTSPLGGLAFVGGPFDGMSLYDFLDLAYEAIGGNTNTGFSYSEYNEAATKINENFDNGTVNKGDLTCASLVPDCKNKIGNFVWHDKNVNGIQDAGEPGIEGVIIELTGTSSSSTTSDASGYYEFSELENGSYTVKVANSNFSTGGVLASSTSEDWYLTRSNIGDDAKDSDADQTNKSTSVTLDCNDNLTVDFGFFRSNFTFEKTSEQTSVNAGDVITYKFKAVNTGDVTLGGSIKVYDAMLNTASPYLIGQKTVYPGDVFEFTKTYTTSDANCGSLVNNAWAIGSPVIPSGISSKGTIRVDDSHTVEVVCDTKVTIGDKVWDDANHNGIQDNGELGIPNVTVKLFDCNDNLEATTTTDENGNYLFTGIIAGDYYVQFVLSAGYSFSPKNVGTAATDSDADVTTGKTECNTFVAGETDLTWDAGMFVNSAFGDKVWNDLNHNGIQDNGELGVPNVTVKLFDCNGNLKATTTTNANGIYLFSNLVAGDYSVQFVLPAGYSFSPMNQGGNTATDSDADVTTGKTTCTTFATGETDLTWDAGIFANSSLGDKVWNDTNNNGIQDADEVGVPNVTVNLYDCDNNLKATTTTDENGNYLFSNIVAGSYVVEFVLPAGYTFSPKNQGNSLDLDSDANVTSGKTTCIVFENGDSDLTWDAGLFANSSLGDRVWNDANHNGIQDDGELGVPNVVVNLLDCDNNAITTTTTDANGNYLFSNLIAGDYTVEFVLPTGYTFSPKNQGGNSAKDSDADLTTGKTTCITFASGTTDLSWDAGIYKNSSLGDKVWEDANNNGIQDNGEAGIPNVVVNLFDCDNNAIATTTTDANGNYLFSNLIAGDYYVVFVRPAGYQFSPKNQGGNTTKDSDADVTGKTTCTNIEAGENDLTWDAGMFIHSELGDLVWYDENKNGIQDLGEDGYSGATVKLFDCSNNLLATTITDANGYYLFENLAVGSYTVKFILPNNYLFTTKNASGSTSETDSDADPATGETECIDLASGEIDLGWDAGIYPMPNNDFDLSIVKTVSNTNPDDEAIVTYTLKVTNNSAVDGTNITVSDVLPAGLVYQYSSPSGYDETTGVWSVGNLNAGDSKSLDITVKIDYLSLGEQPVFNLGIAARYNLFVIKDAVQPSSDTEGRVAVGRNATFGSYSVGDKLPLSGGTDDVLVVGRKLTYTSGQVYSGNVVYGKYVDVSQINLCSDGEIRKDSVVDFAQAEVELNSLSSYLATKQATGTTTFEWGGLHLSGSEPILNVFEIDGNDLSAANSMQIDVPNGSVVLVNINRTNVSWTGGLVVNGTAIGNVLYNFHKAKNLYIQGIDVRGSILAPKAKVNFVTGVINGQMICKYFEGQGQMNNAPFNGSIYGNPEITNCAEIIGFDQVDVDLNNNMACAELVVNVDYNPNNGNEDPESGTWVEFAGTGISEMIWSMYESSNGLLVGTVGGNVYRNNGTDFELLNGSMNVVYIWSLYEYNGAIYAGTEQGLYRYDGSTWTKVAITGDVRSITSLNNVLYAAVWGGGVFSSSDNGATWVAMNNGLMMSGYAVQTLTVANGNLFVGTFGLGVLRYDFTNSTWVELPVGFPYIWMLATDVDNNMYAATSGSGVYASTDNGETWSQINSGLSNMHIYAVSVFGSDVYVSTWSGGVYKFVPTSLGKTDNANPTVKTAVIAGTWSSLGMGGIEVSSIMVDKATQTLYAGTSTGTIYKKLDGTTDVNSFEAVPTKFGLEQNYPNPFNPSTKIQFSIAEAGLYAVKVFNVLGQEIATVANQDFSAGKYTFNFDASNLTSGIYFYKLVGENVNLTKKMMLLK